MSSTSITTTKSRVAQRVIVSNQHRRIGYHIYVATQLEHRSKAILWFYPISGHSLALEYAAPSLSDYQASVICVDRPGIGDTDPQSTTSESDSSELVLQRLQCHADDVLAVLAHHDITHVYLVAVCIGHAFAMEVGRRLLLEAETSTHHPPGAPLRLSGLALVAPFVSTACPDSWRVARLGAHVPTFVLTHLITPAVSWSASRCFVPLFLTPSRVKRLVNSHDPEEQQQQSEQKGYRHHEQWTDSDCSQLCELATRIDRIRSSGHHGSDRAMEVLVGTDPAWQQVCDEFAVLSGYSNNLTKDGVPATASRTTSQNPKNHPPKFPITIRACRKDKVALLPSIQWLIQRCYGNDTSLLHMEEVITSHEVMTFLGGPPRNPVLLHQIAAEWGLR